MPGLGARGDLALGEAPELDTDLVQVVVEARLGDLLPLQPRLHQGPTCLRSGPMVDEPAHGRARSQGLGRGAQADLTGSEDLVLRHRDAADQLREVLPDGERQGQFLALPEPTLAREPLAPPDRAGDGLDRRRHPGQSVDSALVLLHHVGVGAASGRAQRGHRAAHLVVVGPGLGGDRPEVLEAFV